MHLRDFTFRAVIAGILFGIIFGSANAYLGLRVGLTISTAIPLAIVAVAAFRLLKPLFGEANILEQNITQTTGSASSSLASGIIFTIPALFLWGFDHRCCRSACWRFLARPGCDVHDSAAPISYC